MSLAPTTTGQNTPIKADTDRERIRKWNDRRSVPSALRYQQNTSDETSSAVTKQISLRAEMPADLTQMQRYELHAATMCAATGTASSEYGQILFNDTLNIITNAKQHDAAFIANATKDALISLQPQDEIEGMLCTRLIALHSSYMNFMRKAANPEADMIAVDAHVNRATKLMRLYNETLDALSRYRRKGEQKVTVQHINVTNHGQAIVNNKLVTGEGE